MPIDIFITAYLRPAFTQKTLEYLYERTKYSFRVWLLDNGGNEIVAMRMQQDHPNNFHYINFGENLGIMAAWNVALALAESEYFVTTDNDIYVPDLTDLVQMNVPGDIHFATEKGYIDGKKVEMPKQPCWLERMVSFMDERPDFGAISLHPHVIIGNVSEDPNDPEDVKEVDHCGAVMRIMRTEVVRQVGGWEHVIRPQRNGEERWISSKIREAGYKVGRTTRIRAYHPFGENWGYPPEVSPEMQGHRPDLKDYVKQFDQPSAYDPNTWLPL